MQRAKWSEWGDKGIGGWQGRKWGTNSLSMHAWKITVVTEGYVLLLYAMAIESTSITLTRVTRSPESLLEPRGSVEIIGPPLY